MEPQFRRIDFAEWQPASNFFPAEEPERLRGPQFTRAWGDELAAWKHPAAFDQLMMGLRLGKHPQLVLTTTPKPVPLVKNILARVGTDTVLTRGKSEENANNLADGAIATMRERYGNTRWARQELDGDLVEEVEGALWRFEQLENCRTLKTDTEFLFTVIAVDPAVTSHGKSDETGIVAAAKGSDGNFYVLQDLSGKYGPSDWAKRVLTLRDEVKADLIVGEVNEGGDMIEQMLRQFDAYVPFKGVRASKSKVLRAYPIAQLYERGLVKHVGAFAKLEDQMCRFTADGFKNGSPDRVDALVWALTELQQGNNFAPRIRALV